MKEQLRLDLSDNNEASSSRSNLARKISQPIILKNSRLSISSQERKISTLSLAQRQIVKGCMDKAKEDIAERIYRRIIEKRDDFRKFIEALTEEQRNDFATALRNYLKNVVNQLMDGAAVRRISEDFGARHVQYRSAGFRPDFFAVTADAVTTECVLLDAAIHPASDALFAWSTLTTLMFSSVRDGYYNEQRRIRKASQQHINRGKLLLSDEAIRKLNKGRRNSNPEYSFKDCTDNDTDKVNESEISTSTIKKFKDNGVEFRSESVQKIARGRGLSGYRYMVAKKLSYAVKKENDHIKSSQTVTVIPPALPDIISSGVVSALFVYKPHICITRAPFIIQNLFSSSSADESYRAVRCFAARKHQGEVLAVPEDTLP
uniref:Globin family profile domain-containing protein n=1 Tax=Setaria digitata TaxID=48799 RepID=A0A915Q405_9BILA